MSNLTRTQAADLDRYITGNYGMDQDLHDDEAPDVDDGCDVAKPARGHNPDDY
jgi:hypothetical protein